MFRFMFMFSLNFWEVGYLTSNKYNNIKPFDFGALSSVSKIRTFSLRPAVVKLGTARQNEIPSERTHFSI